MSGEPSWRIVIFENHIFEEVKLWVEWKKQTFPSVPYSEDWTAKTNSGKMEDFP